MVLEDAMAPLLLQMETTMATDPKKTSPQPQPAEQPAQQEPVAVYCRECLTYNGHNEGCSHYSPPPAQRTWVGLTLDELNVFEKSSLNRQALCCAIEAKLKEKNT